MLLSTSGGSTSSWPLLCMLRISITAFMFSSRRSALILLIYFQIPYAPVPVIRNFRSKNHSGVRWLSVNKIMPGDVDCRYGSTTSLSCWYLTVVRFPVRVMRVYRPGPKASSVVCINTTRPNPLLCAKAYWV